MCRRAENVCTGGIVEREKEKRTGLLLARTGVEVVRRGGGNQRSQERRRRVPTKTGGYRRGAARPGSYTTPQLAPKLFVSRLERPS
jgi:hypothetical protein